MVNSKGFSLIEILVVVIIIGIMSAIVYPRYLDYVVKGKRVDAMNELQNIGTQIESKKLSSGRGGYKNIHLPLPADYPVNNPSYRLTVENLETGKWKLIATPTSSKTQINDGTLTLNYNGQKCRAASCGMGDEWNK